MRILPLMKDPNHDDSEFGAQVEGDMALDREAQKARRKMITPAPKQGLLRELIEPRFYDIEILLRLSLAPMKGGVVGDACKVGLGLLGQVEARH